LCAFLSHARHFDSVPAKTRLVLISATYFTPTTFKIKKAISLALDSLFYFENGWSGGGTTEPTPLTARLVYSERWAKKKIDPLELVTLRESGLTWRQIATRLGVCKTTVLRAIRLSRQG
jgi:hypothetical protein